MADALRKLEVAAAGGRRGLRAALLALGLVVLQLGAVVATDVAIDPRGDFGGTRFRPIVDDIPREKLDLYEAAAADHPVPALILGSSRAMPFPPSALPDGGFNFGILGGSLLDDRLAYDTVVRRQGPVHLVVIELDSFQLLDLPDGRLWSEVASSHAASRFGAASSTSHLVGALHDTLSAGYLGDSLHVLDLTYRTGYPVAANTFLPDGQGLRPLVDPLIANGTYDFPAAFEHNWQKFLGNIYTSGSAMPDEVANLQELVRKALADGAQVQVVLPPFHRLALARLEPNPVFVGLQDTARRVLLDLCGPGLSVFDYTHVEAFGGQPDGFYDGYHVVPANGRLMLQAMQAGLGDECQGGTHA